MAPRSLFPVRRVQTPDLTGEATVLEVERVPRLVERETLTRGVVSHPASPSLVAPGLVASPAVTPDQPHLGAQTCSVQAVVVGPDLAGLSDGEHLVAAQAVAGRHSHPAPGLPAHRVQAPSSS